MLYLLDHEAEAAPDRDDETLEVSLTDGRSLD